MHEVILGFTTWEIHKIHFFFSLHREYEISQGFSMSWYYEFLIEVFPFFTGFPQRSWRLSWFNSFKIDICDTCSDFGLFQTPLPDVGEKALPFSQLILTFFFLIVRQHQHEVPLVVYWPPSWHTIWIQIKGKY